jgi:hypothetical protein
MKLYKCYKDFELDINGSVKMFYKDEYYPLNIVEADLGAFLKEEDVEKVCNIMNESHSQGNEIDISSLLIYCESKELLLG